MNQTKTCPKCSCTELLWVDDGVGDRSICLHLGLFNLVPVSRWVCTRCGYTESWVDQRYISDIRKQYEKEQRKK